MPRSRQTLALAALTAATVVASLISAGPLTADPATASTAATTTASAVSTTPTAADLHGDEIAVPSRPTSRLQGNKSTGTTSTSTSSVDKIYVARVSVTSTTSDDDAKGVADSSITSAVTSLDDYWSKQSAGAVDIAYAGVEDDSLKLTTCDPSSVLDTVAKTAFGGAFANYSWIGTHRHLIVLTREGSLCGKQAFGTVGGVGGMIFTANGMDQDLGVSVLLHEFGHNLGFRHADAALCRSATDFDGADSDFAKMTTTASTALCPAREYGDYSDIMGYSLSGARPGLSTIQRSLAGYISDLTDVATAGTTESYTIRPLGGTTPGRGLRITDPLTDTVYYIEYRAKTGTDATDAEFGNYLPNCDDVGNGYTRCSLAADATTGMVRVLRVLPDSDTANGYPETMVLAAGLNGGSGPAKRFTHLETGESFASYGGGIRLTVKSLSPTAGATVSVTLASTGTATRPVSAPDPSPTPTPTAEAPTDPIATTTRLTVNTTSQYYASSTRVGASVQVTGADGTVPTGTITWKLDGSAKAASTLPANGRSQYSLPSSTHAGTHRIQAFFTPADSTASAASTSTAVTVTVKKRPSSMRTSIPATTVRTSSNPKITVVAVAAGVANPTGTITVTASGKVVKRYTLTSSNKGRVTLTLPRFTRAGKYAVVASYSGTGDITSSSVKAGTITVKK